VSRSADPVLEATMNRGYAYRTSVPVARTREEIETLLTKHNATGFVYGNSGGRALVMFEMKERRLKFLVPMPTMNKSGSNENAIASETRRRWRALLLVLKAKLEAVDSEIVLFDEEFLAHIVIDGMTTVGDRLVPEMKKALTEKTLPPLLGAGRE
jgi:hypothetical protein